MKRNTLEKVYECLSNESNRVVVEKDTLEKALAAVERMVAIS